MQDTSGEDDFLLPSAMYETTRPELQIPAWLAGVCRNWTTFPSVPREARANRFLWVLIVDPSSWVLSPTRSRSYHQKLGTSFANEPDFLGWFGNRLKTNRAFRGVAIRTTFPSRPLGAVGQLLSVPKNEFPSMPWAASQGGLDMHCF